MVDTSYWDNYRGVLRSQKGGWVVGEAVYNHGYSMLDELVGKATFMQVLILNVTGRLVERRLADWMEAYFNCLSWPDARVWCNQIGSLGGTMRTSPVAAVGAGILAADSRMYGPGAAIAGVEFIINALKKKRAGMTAEDIVREQQRRPGSVPAIVGYIRPVASGDERIPAMERVTTQLNFAIGEHLTLAYEIEQVMLQKFNEGMNIAGYRSAFLADQGFSPQEVYRTLAACVHSGVLACYAEAADSPPESFLPLRCDDIDYQGKPPRPLPEDYKDRLP